ncbi:MAG: Trk K+ transport system NAD-binding subunit [Motiliproteus sp.]|jgi:Trk K+ transport system NAD-binding subunit
MKIIILGAGQVGATLAKHLVKHLVERLANEANDINIIDTEVSLSAVRMSLIGTGSR